MKIFLFFYVNCPYLKPFPIFIATLIYSPILLNSPELSFYIRTNVKENKIF